MRNRPSLGRWSPFAQVQIQMAQGPGKADRRCYFSQLMSTHEEIRDSVRPLLKLCREHIDRSIRMDRALLGSLQRDPLLSE